MQNNPSMNAPPSPHYSFFLFVYIVCMILLRVFFFDFIITKNLIWNICSIGENWQKKTTLYLSIIKIENFWVAYSSFVTTKKQVLKECIKFNFYPNQIQMTIRRTFNFLHFFKFLSFNYLSLFHSNFYYCRKKNILGLPFFSHDS